MTNRPDDRSLLATAMTWSSVVTSIALEMALPPLAGSWADQWLGTGPWLVSLGAVFGLAAGLWHLVRVTAKPGLHRSRSNATNDRSETKPDGEDETF